MNTELNKASHSTNGVLYDTPFPSIKDGNLLSSDGTVVQLDNIDRTFLSAIRRLMEEQNITIKQLSEIMYAQKKHIDTNFTLYRGFTYSKASVLCAILMDRKRFGSLEEVTTYGEESVNKFYDKLIQAFEVRGLTYLLAEELSGVSHSTLYCYKKKKKKPHLKNAVILSTALKFDLSFDFFQVVDRSNKTAQKPQ